MQISTKFTIGIHMLCAIQYFGAHEKVTSELLSGSIGTNPVIIRNIMSDLKKAGLIDTKRGTGGINITKPLTDITFYDVYEAVEKNKDQLFDFHDHPSPRCPVGRNIHAALDDKLNQAQKDFEDDLKNFNTGSVYNEIIRKIQEQEG